MAKYLNIISLLNVYMVYFELVTILIALIIGTYTDFKVREVPDWLNFTLIGLGAGIAVIKSISMLSFSPIISSAIGFGIALTISLIMFYTGQWGGGDAKMLMGMGAVLGATFSLEDFFISFNLNLIIAGAIYGLIWGIFLGIIKRKELIPELKIILKNNLVVKAKYIVFFILSAIIISLFIIKSNSIRLAMFSFGVIIYFTLYLWVYIRGVENVCMIKKVIPNKLTEGDWIFDEVLVGKKVIASKKDLGVSKEQIEKLKKLYIQKKVGLITIKEGIPFIPSFLISFILTFFYGNLFFKLIVFF